MKVTGFIPEGCSERDFRIEHDGRTWYAVRSGSLFECNGCRGTLKKIKQEILEGRLPDSAAMDDTAVADAPEPLSEAKGRSTWECVHPAAIVAAYFNVICNAATNSDRALILESLDSYGYVRPDGLVDMAAAGREFLRVRNLPPASLTPGP